MKIMRSLGGINKMNRPVRYLLLLLCLLGQLAGPGLARGGELTLADVRHVFPTAETISPLNGKAPAYMVRGAAGQLGYAFSTEAVAPISAYSGKPIDSPHLVVGSLADRQRAPVDCAAVQRLHAGDTSSTSNPRAVNSVKPAQSTMIWIVSAS